MDGHSQEENGAKVTGLDRGPRRCFDRDGGFDVCDFVFVFVTLPTNQGGFCSPPDVVHAGWWEFGRAGLDRPPFRVL